MVSSSSSSSSSSSAVQNQKISYHSLLAAKLSKLTIPSSSTLSSSSAVAGAAQDFDFNDVFGPPTPTATTSNPTFHGDPQPNVINNRSHSFVGPSPRFATAQSQPFDLELDEDDEEEDEESGPENGEANDGVCGEKRSQSVESTGSSGLKIGPGDFEILRVVGKGAFGKVFQVRKKVIEKKKKNSCSDGDEDGDGIYAMKVMRKDTIIKKNHVDYMKAERDILTKVVHPFIVQLRYSFQVS